MGVGVLTAAVSFWPDSVSCRPNFPRGESAPELTLRADTSRTTPEGSAEEEAAAAGAAGGGAEGG